MKNQLRDTRERNSKVIKEKDLLILDLQNQLEQLKINTEDLKLYEPLKNENDKLKRELQEKTNRFHETKSTLEHRITKLIAEKEKNFATIDAGTSEATFIVRFYLFLIPFKILLSSVLNQYSEEILHVFIIVISI